MSNISKISASGIPASGSASSQPTIASLQSQLQLYSQYENGTGAATEDYKALQFAIQSNNISNAQAALARLKRDSEGSGTPPSATANATVSTDNDGGSSESPAATPGVSGNSIDTTA